MVSYLKNVLYLFITIALSTPCFANDLDKYSNVKLGVKQLERLAKYDGVIRYYCENMQLYGPENRVNPNFLRALIIAESNIIEDAISGDKAYGLTQITSATGNLALQEIEKARMEYEGIAEEKNQRIKLSGDDLLNPDVNIFLATYLLSKYNADYDGRLDLIVSAWNAGPGSIKNDMPPDYKETLDIIGKINGYYHLLLSLKERGLSILQ